MRIRLAAVAILTSCITALGQTDGQANDAVASPTTDPAARVNGIAIERREVQELVKGLARAEPSPPDTARIESLMHSALESLIDLELLYQEAVRTKVPLADGEVDREIERLQRHFASKKAFNEALAKRGLTTAGLRVDTRRTLMADRLLQRTVWRELSVSSEEIEAFYSENASKLDKPFEELQDSIGLLLLDEKRAAARTELVAKLRKQSKIERLPPFDGDAAAKEKPAS